MFLLNIRLILQQIKNISYNNQAIAVKMKKTSLTYQQRQWIEDAYQTIVENPEALGYDSIDGHLDEIVNDIKEEVDQIFCIDINTESIINIIN